MEEECMSKPGFKLKIKRPKSVKVRFTAPNGETQTKAFAGLTARVVLQAVDLLESIPYTTRANQAHLEQAKNKYKKLIRQRKKVA
jgi:peptide deformylase